MADVTDATFETEVIDRSERGPRRGRPLGRRGADRASTLGPILEKVVAATDGKVELVKVDVDENPQSRQAFQVQSIPAVYALKDGAVVDGFVGAQGEAAVQDFVDGLLPTEDDRGRPSGSGGRRRRGLARAGARPRPDNERVIVALAELVADGRGRRGPGAARPASRVGGDPAGRGPGPHR